MVDLSGKFTDVAGVTHRISQLLERLNALEEFWKDLYPDDHGTSPSCDALDRWSEARIKIRSNLGSSNRDKENANDNKADDNSSDSRKLLIWSLDNVAFCPPMSAEPLLTKLTFDLVVGESLLITGPSSAGI